MIARYRWLACQDCFEKSGSQTTGMKVTWGVCVLSHSVVPAVCDLIDWSPPGSSVHGIFQARILECVAISPSEDLPTQGLNPCLLHLLQWQADSLPPCHLGSLKDHLGSLLKRQIPELQSILGSGVLKILLAVLEILKQTEVWEGS